MIRNFFLVAEPPLKPDTSSEPHILLKASFAIKKFMVRGPAHGRQPCRFCAQSLNGELMNRKATNFLCGQVVVGEGRMALNKRGGLD